MDSKENLTSFSGSNPSGRQLTEVSSFQLVTYSIQKLDLQDLIKVPVQPPVPVLFEGNFSVNLDLGYYRSPWTLQVTTHLHDPKKGVFKLAYALEPSFGCFVKCSWQPVPCILEAGV
ncbi:hypothetical protein C8J56DRAFT_1042353 [Mycena floridula]|nr:hypothetical protein C8J56DRAFT_1042353 [Mycena floridula]